MADLLSTAFRGPWRLDTKPTDPDNPQLAIVPVLLCQEAWRRLTKTSQAALVAIGADCTALETVNGRTRKCLTGHGLLDETGRVSLTGQAVLRYRPSPVHGPTNPGGGA